MGRPGLPRQNPGKPFEGYPAYGAVHDVMPNQQLRSFMYDYTRICDYVFMHKAAGVEVDPVIFPEEDDSKVSSPLEVPKHIKLEVEETYDARNYYRVFDTETLGASVVEMDPSKRHAKLIRSIWERNDFGAVEQEARTEIGRSLPGTVPKLFFDRVSGVGGRLPGVHKTEVRKKLALMPDTSKFPETLTLISEEADIIINAIRRRLKQFVYPWDINPHLTYSVFRTRADEKEITTIQKSTNNYLSRYPFAVRLGTLDFRNKKERGQSTRR